MIQILYCNKQYFAITDIVITRHHCIYKHDYTVVVEPFFLSSDDLVHYHFDRPGQSAHGLVPNVFMYGMGRLSLFGGFPMSFDNRWFAKRFSAVPANIMGMGHMFASVSTISGVNGIVVHLSHSMHVFEIAFFRQAIGFVFMSAIFLRGGLRPLITRRFGLHVLRSIFNVIAMLAFFYGLTLEPLAKVVSLSFTAPLFATVGAVLLLREKMTRHRWIALGIGVIGALIIVVSGLIIWARERKGA